MKTSDIFQERINELYKLVINFTLGIGTHSKSSLKEMSKCLREDIEKSSFEQYYKNRLYTQLDFTKILNKK